MRNWKKVAAFTLTVSALVIATWVIGSQFELNKGEWASWVQAIGSIAAILGAIWISNQQHAQALARERQQAIRRKQEIRDTIFVVANQGHELIKGIPATNDNDQWISYLQLVPKVHFQNLENLLRGAPLYEVGGLALPAAIHMMEALERATRLLTYVATLDPIKRVAIGERIASDVKRVHFAADAAMVAFRLEMEKTNRGE
jgi:hypothetical protein